MTPLGHQVMKAAVMSMTPQSRPAEIMAAKARKLFVSAYAGVEGFKSKSLCRCYVLLRRSEKKPRRRRLLAIDDAVFHYKGNFLQGGDVLKRVAGDGDDVGVVAGF